MEHYFDLDTHQLVYRLQEAPGRPRLLFLHGCGASHSQFEREFQRFSGKYSVAALSLRGQGRSTRPAGNQAEDMSIPALANDVILWMRTHNWQKPHVVASSMGGVVALEVLNQQPDLFGSLITFGTTPCLAMPQAVIKTAAWLTDVFLPGLFPNAMARLIAKAATDKKESRQRFMEDLKVAYSQRKTIYQLRCALANYNYIDLMQKLDLPILLLQGEKDRDINQSIAKVWPLISQNRLVRQIIMPDAGHIANYDQPQLFYEQVNQFIEEQIA